MEHYRRLTLVLDAGTLMLPSDISIISWNYDSLIEMAYKAYHKSQTLPIFEKNILNEWPQLSKFGRIFKVNGSATFANRTIFWFMLKLLPNEECA